MREATRYRRGTNPRSLENLNKGRPWQKGESGNLSGRPKLEQALTPIMRRYLAMPYVDFDALDMTNATAAEVLAWNTVYQAIHSVSERLSISARTLVWDRLEGSVQKLEPVSQDDARWVELQMEILERYAQRLKAKGGAAVEA